MIGVAENQPLFGLRKIIAKFFSRLASRINLFSASFIWISYRNPNIDYTEWLGANYKNELPKRPPIIIGNHQSWSVFLKIWVSRYRIF